MPRVSIEGKTDSYNLEEEELVYDGLERQGLELPHGCLAGSCGACRIEILEGTECLKDPSAIEQNTLESIKENYEKNNGAGSLDGKNIRLACRARILSGEIKIKPFR
jgi:ferredoxin